MQDPIDRADDDAARNRQTREAADVLRESLKIELLAAMANGEGSLREFRDDGKPHEIGRDLPSMLRDLLDDVQENENESALMRALVNVLRFSECPEVASWRLLAAAEYAKRADDIACMESDDA